ncbi:MAG: GerMN domain-containing protein [Treponema sp.]|jgi:spore germination protein GerM|nr:GerMN domain-containing protein [Treponema sp.]
MALWKGGSAKGPGGKGGVPRKAQRRQKPWALIFWTAFVLVIFGLFLLNKNSIGQTLEKTQFIERILNKQVSGTGANPAAETGPEGRTDMPGENKTALPETPATPAKPPAENAKPAAQDATPAKPAESAKPAAQDAAPAKPAENAKPAAQDAAPAKPPAETPALRDRTLYFTRVDSDGVILREKALRKFPVSDTPMVDALRALISGPSPAEKNSGLLSLIPEKTKILQATVRGSTAYISFSEDFQFNVYGVEGYAASLRQIVWTVTEFPNVADVQILIEGRRVDYLGEGIWIGSPVSREML